jgi:hypothetical protein
LHVFPLTAKFASLNTFMAKYLTDNERYTFSVQATPATSILEDDDEEKQCFIYVVIANLGHVKAHPGYSERVVFFGAPIQCTRRESGKSTPALVPLYTFAGTDWYVATENEVYGRLTLRSTLSSPRSEWISAPVPIGAVSSKLLTVHSTVFPQEERAQKAEERLVIEMFSQMSRREIKIGVAPDYYIHLVDIQRDLQYIEDDPFTKTGLNLYFDRSGKMKPNYSIALQQVRDAKEPAKAAYQSIVCVRRTITGTWLQQKGIQIRITQFPGLPILKNLGLTDEDGGAKTLSTEDGVSTRGRLIEDNGNTLCWRIGTDAKWEEGPSPII